MKPILPILALAVLAACARPPEPAPPQPPLAPALSARVKAIYGKMEDDGITIPAVDPALLSEDKARQDVPYVTDEPPGTIVVDPYARRLYFVEEDNRAIRYTVAVGKAGRGFSGRAHIPYQRDWPRWTPTRSMLAEDPDLYGPVKDGLSGGLDNPLGARALYLHQGNKDTLYRIHGTMNDASIGQATSAGCIRLFNQDIIDLANRVRSGTKVVVLSQEQSGHGTPPPDPNLTPDWVTKTGDTT